MGLKKTGMNLLPGVILALVLAIPAWYLGKRIPVVGGPVFGILLGMAAAFWKRPAATNAGIKFTSKKLLQTAIILLGFEMNLYNVYTTGRQSLAIILVTLAAAFLAAWLAGHFLGIRGNTRTLIGVGTAICGGSAIAAASSVLEAEDREVAYAVSTIFLFNVAAVFIFPFAGHMLGMSEAGFGMWAGTAINDTSSVLAAAFSFGSESGSLATVVKLTRTLMIVPVTLVLALLVSRKKTGGSGFRFTRVFPWFVLGFLAASVLSTSGILPIPLCKAAAQVGKFLIIAAMAAIGLNTNLKQMAGNGIKPVLLGFSCWAAVALSSLAVQHWLGLW